MGFSTSWGTTTRAQDTGGAALFPPPAAWFLGLLSAPASSSGQSQPSTQAQIPTHLAIPSTGSPHWLQLVAILLRQPPRCWDSTCALPPLVTSLWILLSALEKFTQESDLGRPWKRLGSHRQKISEFCGLRHRSIWGCQRDFPALGREVQEKSPSQGLWELGTGGWRQQYLGRGRCSAAQWSAPSP